MSIAEPGYDEVILTTPDTPRPCNSLACSEAGRLAEVIVSYGVLNDPGASYHARDALWRESWGQSYPMCGACWNSSRQVAIKYRPRLIIRDLTRQGPAPAASLQPGASTTQCRTGDQADPQEAR